MSLCVIYERMICKPTNSPKRAGDSFEKACVKGPSPNKLRKASTLLEYNVLSPTSDAHKSPSKSFAHSICLDEYPNKTESGMLGFNASTK